MYHSITVSLHNINFLDYASQLQILTGWLRLGKYPRIQIMGDQTASKYRCLLHKHPLDRWAHLHFLTPKLNLLQTAPLGAIV